MLQHIRPAVVLLVLFSALTGLVYPLADHRNRADRAAAPGQRQPDREGRRGRRLGADRAELQDATAISIRARRRPPTRDPNDSTKTIDAPYNAANSTGSNLGPTSQKLVDRVKAAVEAWRAAGWSRAGPRRRRDDLCLRARPGYLAGDALRAGRRGREGARPARKRKCAPWSRPRSSGRLLGLIGEPRVNILLLNLALDRLKSS